MVRRFRRRTVSRCISSIAPWAGSGENHGKTPEVRLARRTRDLIEEELFQSRRDLFATLDLVFDTTSLVFTGDDGKSLGQYGKSKDRCNDCKQMVLGMVIDSAGIPICCEMWPGNTADVTTLDLVAGRLQQYFGWAWSVWSPVPG